MTETYYDVLQVTKTAQEWEIKKSWKNLCREYHPDKCEDKQHGETMIKKINEAYTVIGDPDKRAKYDKFGKEGMDDPRFNMHANMNGFFNTFFEHKKPRSQEIPPIRIVLETTLKDAHSGVSAHRDVKRLIKCPLCDGTKSKNKTATPCGTCRGQGIIGRLVQIGPNMMQQIQSICPACDGRKVTIPKDQQCTQCNATGTITETVVMAIQFPPGIKNNEYTVIENQGNYMDGCLGPVVFVIQEQDHPNFHRHPNNPYDLVTEMHISLQESLCGFAHELTFITGEKVTIYHSSIITNNTVKLLPHYGLPYKGEPHKIGDLHIKFVVDAPIQLTDEQKQIIHKTLTGSDFVDQMDIITQDYQTLTDVGGKPREPSHDDDGPGECKQQ